ncbi:MAG: hypothetical protein LC104_14225 [Bacteroidales bacterium]|nr:hypothetical protein [Bacteroidales bacterium]
MLALVAVGGCVPRQQTIRTAEFFQRVRGWAGMQSGAGVYLQTALIDVPAPNRYLDHELWSAPAVANPVSPEQTALLELNGLRVRVISGVAPPRFLELVTSEHSVLNPMLRSAPPDTPKVIPVNGPLQQAQCRVRTDLKADDTELVLTDAECGLRITAQPTENGKITLTCEPQVQHGANQAWIRPNADGTGFMRKEQKAQSGYPTLSWEVTAGPHDYLIIGPTEDPTGTLGELFFHARSGEQVRQRVLVVRTGKRAEAAPTHPTRPSRTNAAAAAQSPGFRAARGATP